MRKFVSISIVSALFAGCSTVGTVQSETTFARDAFADRLESGELPGGIGVFYDDGVQETACLGYSDVESKRPIGMDDLFMQCSQTKAFCGVTMAILVEEGKVALDDPVSKYLPEFSKLVRTAAESNGVSRIEPAANVMTIRMCLNHTSGLPFELPNYIAMGGWSRKMPIRSVAACAASLPLLFEPGTRVRYSNLGIDVAAAVIETVTGRRWEDFLQERVLDPLEMADTTFRPTDGQLAGKIELYKVAPGKKAEWIPQDKTMQRPYNDDRVFPSAGAGLWTTANDQLKFYKMLMNLGLGDNGVRILKAETVKNLLAVSTRPENLGGYSLGLTAPRHADDGPAAWFGHGGARGSNCAVNWRKRRLKLWIVQVCGQQDWRKVLSDAGDRFFAERIDTSGVDEYTGRTE